MKEALCALCGCKKHFERERNKVVLSLVLLEIKALALFSCLLIHFLEKKQPCQLYLLEVEKSPNTRYLIKTVGGDGWKSIAL